MCVCGGGGGVPLGLQKLKFLRFLSHSSLGFLAVALRMSAEDLADFILAAFAMVLHVNSMALCPHRQESVTMIYHPINPSLFSCSSLRSSSGDSTS